MSRSRKKEILESYDDKEVFGKKKKAKDFLIEFKWKDEASWDKSLKWFSNKVYTPDFQGDLFRNKYGSLKSAKEAIKARIKDAENTRYESFKEDLNKIFRIKNIKTQEIFNYE